MDEDAIEGALTESQRRVIGSGMLIVDAAAVRMLNLLEHRSSVAAMSVVEGEVSEKEQSYIRSRAKELQALIGGLVKKYQLQPSKRNLRRILAADASQIWVTLEDCRPTRIRGYGEMSAATASLVEADMQEMLQIANGLRALLSS
ncbi:MAG TPA: hypothetical protein VMB18_16545 [Terriglobales bacterium]|nr:hypothetical protein [Terriglobales bacterium]